MSLLDKIKKNSTIKDTAILSESKFFNKKDMIPTPIPALNIALSGRLDGGLTPGLTMWAGPSKHFKTAFSLMMARSYLDKDFLMVLLDAEQLWVMLSGILGIAGMRTFEKQKGVASK